MQKATLQEALEAVKATLASMKEGSHEAHQRSQALQRELFTSNDYFAIDTRRGDAT